MRLGILGGSFDPPHRGHLEVARRACAVLRLDRVLLVPNARSPWKPEQVGRATGADRLAMVRDLVTASRESASGEEFLEVCEIEIRRGGVSFTVDTLRELRTLYPGAELVFLLGADALAGLSRWREPEELAKLAVFAVHARPGFSLTAPEGFRVEVVPGDDLPIASSVLRDRLERALPVQPDVPFPVAERIEASLLYLPSLSASLAAHVATVVGAGVALAGRWSLPEADVELACRYHDIYRGTAPEELLTMAAAAGESLDDHDREFPLLLHGRLAGRRLAATGPRDPDARRRALVDAVRYHTTGRAGMSGVEIAVAVADQVGKIWPSVGDVPMDRREAWSIVVQKKLARSARRRGGAHPLLRDAAAELGLGETSGRAA